MKYFSYYKSLIGKLTLISNGEKLNVVKGETHRFYDNFCEGIIENDNLPVFVDTKKWLDRYFNCENPRIDELPIELNDTDFRIDVWNLLCDIPLGSVVTYGDLAKKMAIKRGKKRMSAQAVGNAVGLNPISIIIPCHRVVGGNGSLVGYGGGISNKIKLLEFEGIDTSEYTIPTKGNAL